MSLNCFSRYTALVAKDEEKALGGISKILNIEVQTEKEIAEQRDCSERKHFRVIFETISSSTWIALVRDSNSWIMFHGAPNFDYVGRFTIQLIGFFFMTVFMFALAIPYHHWTLKENNMDFVVIIRTSKADPGYPAGIGTGNSLLVLGGINVRGLFLTFLVPEPEGRSLEETSGENEEGNQEQSMNGAQSV
ncbi:hypothetical protein REPUB_Repub02eG0098000 [Reevesia pubescens]